MSKNNYYVDIHAIQTVPPSCVNRDDTGTPKQCTYGGAQRARVSSQSWKRAIRLAFCDMYAPEDLANRTKNIVGMVTAEVQKLKPEADAEALAIAVLEAAGLSIDAKDPSKGTEALFFMSMAQARALAALAIEEQPDIADKKEKDKAKKAYANRCKQALKENPSIDLALFGRMVASDASLNYDAAAMVAHAISTHKVQNEFDYFTAVDDLKPEESAGAGHLGTVEFNSSTLYRYASVNVRELKGSLGSDTAAAVRNFVEAFLLSMPTGKLATFANRSLPNAVYITVRRDQPVNMAAAFEKPVQVDEEGGYVAGSEQALIKYAASAYANFVNEPEKAWTIGEGMEMLGDTVNLKTLLAELEACLNGVLTEGM